VEFAKDYQLELILLHMLLGRVKVTPVLMLEQDGLHLSTFS